jgi:hypothetical protein
MQRLAGVFFEVRAGDADRARGTVVEADLDLTGAHDRALELTDLIALRQVRIEVVLSVEDTARADVRADRNAERHGHSNRRFVQHRQCTG